MAQPCIVTNYDFDPASHTRWRSADMYSDGGVISALLQFPSFGDLLLMKLAPTGQQIWTKRINPTNPLVELELVHTTACSDGGAFAFGRTKIWTDPLHTSYFRNYFGIRVNALGDVIWARYYMYHTFECCGEVYANASVELPNGDLMLALTRTNGFNLVRLDAEGAPSWEKRYEVDPGSTYNWINALKVEASGDLLVMGKLGQSFIASIGGDGSVNWSRRYSGGSYIYDAVRTPSGELLLAADWSMGVLRTDGQGIPIWRRTYQMHCVGLGLLPNGGFIITDWDRFRMTDANGFAISSWDPATSPAGGIYAGLIGDSLKLLHHSGSWEAIEMKMLRAHYTDLSCYAAAVPPNSAIAALPAEVAHSIALVDDTLKTWTMSVPGTAEYNALDLECQLASGIARPGFNFTYAGLINNLGGLSSGPVSVVLTHDPLLTFTSAVPPPILVTSNTVQWNLGSFLGFQDSLFHVHFQVPTTAVLGTPIEATISANQIDPEVSLSNNLATLLQEIRGSYDPNDKSVTPVDVYSIEQDSTLNYTIRFQNTGTDTAFTVLLADTLPPQVHASSFVAGPSSHPYTYTLTGEGVLTFRFDDILLPDSNVNEAASHGFVSFCVEPDETLLPGTVISNSADIFFDFNEPIRTNAAVVTFSTSTGIGAEQQPRLAVYPIPSKDLLTVEWPMDLNPIQLIIGKPDGMLVLQRSVQGVAGRVSVPVQSLPAGIYHVTLRDPQGRGVTERFVKE